MNAYGLPYSLSHSLTPPAFPRLHPHTRARGKVCPLCGEADVTQGGLECWRLAANQRMSTPERETTLPTPSYCGSHSLSAPLMILHACVFRARTHTHTHTHARTRTRAGDGGAAVQRGVVRQQSAVQCRGGQRAAWSTAQPVTITAPVCTRALPCSPTSSLRGRRHRRAALQRFRSRSRLSCRVVKARGTGVVSNRPQHGSAKVWFLSGTRGQPPLQNTGA